MIKKILKIIGIIFVLLFVAVIGYVSGNLTKYSLDVRKADKAVDRFQGSLEQPYKEDTYGGKTPEETWAMYIDAVKKGDVDLASMYYAVGVQKKRRDFLVEEKQIDGLKLYIEQLSTPLQKDESLPDFILANKEKAHYYYMVKDIETGEMIKNTVEFYVNPYTKVWKIVF